MNDPLRTLGVYLKTKAFGWCFFGLDTYSGMGPYKKKLKKIKTAKSEVNFSQKLQVDRKDSLFPFAQIRVQ